MSTSPPLSIGRLAATAGVSLDTIRHYERIGLMPPPDRSRGGHRNYRAQHRERLSFILRAVELGFNLNEVRDLISLSAPEDRNCEQARAIAVNHLKDVRAKIADLQRLEEVLNTAVSRCDPGVLPHCPVIQVLTSAA